MSKLGIKILKMFGLVAGMAMLILSATYIYVFSSVEATLKEEVTTSITESLQSVDAKKFESLAKNKSNEASEFTEILNSMLIFKSKQDIKNLYTYIKKDDNAALFLVDASPEAADFLEEYEMSEEILRAFNGEIVTVGKPYTDEWGTFISAYAPIKSASGEVIGVIGADADIEIFQNIKTLFLKMFIVAAGAFLLLSLIIVNRFSKGVQKSIKILQRGLEHMSKGDLIQDIKVSTKDEIEVVANSINKLRVDMNNTLNLIKKESHLVLGKSRELSTISTNMSSSARNVSTAIQEIAVATSSQATGLENIHGAIIKFNEQIDSVCGQVKDMNLNASDIDNKIKNSSRELDELIRSIKEIKSVFNEVINRVKALGVSVEKINEITDFINNIADQTNLLALNAAIEAARAGEVGKGFAVVADEIRVLAEQSKDSSQNINKILEGIIVDNTLMSDITNKVDKHLSVQEQTINTTAGSFIEIIQNIEEVIIKINEIHSSMNVIGKEKTEIIKNIEYTSAISEEISASSEEISASTEEISTSTEEVAKASQNLTSMMNVMSEAINHFKTII